MQRHEPRRYLPWLVMVISSGFALACDWPWTRDNPYDPSLCAPPCGAGKECFQGSCVTARALDGGSADVHTTDGPSPSRCKNLMLDPGESCDGALLGDKTCASLGFAGGTLRCKDDCTFDTSQCEATQSACAAPVELPLRDGRGSVDGGTSGAADEFGGIGCMSPVGPFRAGQVYYRVSLATGLYHTISLEPKNWDAALYAFDATTRCDKLAIDAACRQTYSDRLGAGQLETIGIPPAQMDSAYVIAVDGRAPAAAGPFTLSVISNDYCAGAQPLVFDDLGHAEVSSNTGLAKVNDVRLSQASCTGRVVTGNDLFYRVKLPANSVYRITATPLSAQLPMDLILYAIEDCQNPEKSCVAGSRAGGAPSVDSTRSILLMNPGAPQVYTIGVVAADKTLPGPFRLSVERTVHPSPWVSFDFERGNCGPLAATGDWECGDIRFQVNGNCGNATPRPPKTGHSGMGMWGTVLNGCYQSRGNNEDFQTCKNRDITDDSILSFNVEVPFSWTSQADLTFFTWEDIDLPEDWYEIRVDGQPVYSRCGGYYTAPVAWKPGSINLLPYAGKTVKVAFHFLSSKSVAYSGLYLDDIALIGR